MRNIFSDVLVTMLRILLDSLITASSVTMKDMSLNRVSRYSRGIPIWCARRDLNPHDLWSRDSKSRVSTFPPLARIINQSKYSLTLEADAWQNER